MQVQIVLILASLYQTDTVSVYLHITQTTYINKQLNAVSIISEEKMISNTEGSFFYAVFLYVIVRI